MRRLSHPLGFVAGTFAIVLALLLAGGWIWLAGGWGRRWVAAQAGSVIGRPVAIGGVAIESVWPPTVALTDVRIPNANWAGDAPLLRARSVSLVLAGGSLLHGRVAVRRIRVDQPVVRIARDDHGAVNWPRPSRGGNGGRPLPAIEATHVTLHYRSPAFADGWSTTLPRVSATGTGEPARIRLKAARGGGFNLSLSRNVVAALERADADHPLEIAVEDGGGRIRYHGALGVSPFHLEGRLDASLKKPAAFLSPFGVDAPGLPAIDLSARLTNRGDTVFYDVLKMPLFGGRLSGDGALKPSGNGSLTLTAHGQIRALDLAALAAGLGTKVERFAATLNGHFRVSLNPARPLDTLDGRIVLQVDKGVLPQQLVQKASLDFGSLLEAGGSEPAHIRCGVGEMVVKHGVGHVKTLVIRTPDATVAGEGDVDFARRRLDLSIQADSGNVAFLDTSAPIRINGPFSHPTVSAGAEYAIIEGGAKALLGVVAPPAAALVAGLQQVLGDQLQCGDIAS